MSGCTSLVGTMRVAVGPATSRPLTATHAFLVYQGILFAFMGLSFIAIPQLVGSLLCIGGRDDDGNALPAFSPEEEPYVAATGFALIIVGYFYVQGGRSNAEHFVASTVLDRLTIVPLGCGLLFWKGLPAQLCLLMSLLDATLALLTHSSWRNYLVSSSKDEKKHES